MITTYFLVIIAIISFLIISGTAIGLNLNKSKYFKEVTKDDCPEVEFFIKKHTIFRFFALTYSVIHYSLNIISTTATIITVYMIMDSSINVSIQIFFLLTAAIATNLLFGLRMDKVSEAYAQAMRILETAILKYCLDEDAKKEILYEANEKAEECIGYKFF